MGIFDNTSHVVVNVARYSQQLAFLENVSLSVLVSSNSGCVFTCAWFGLKRFSLEQTMCYICDKYPSTDLLRFLRVGRFCYELEQTMCYLVSVQRRVVLPTLSDTYSLHQPPTTFDTIYRRGKI